jgi:hypothetical protein
MKILKCFILSTLIFSACSSHDTSTTCKEESIENSTYLEVKPLTYQGHRYLWVRAQSRRGFGGITHDPDCKCYYQK